MESKPPEDAKSGSSLPRLTSSKSHTFISPVKQIHDGQDVSKFLTSKAYSDIMNFLLQLNRSVFARHIHGDNTERAVQIWELGSPDVVFSSTIIGLRSLLNALYKIIDEIPLDTGPRRFGNVSFRDWSRTVEERSSDLLRDHLPKEVLSFQHSTSVAPIDELRSYFLGSFGSAQRLDYGTGHELSFLAFLGCIWKLGGFDTSVDGSEERGIVLGVIDLFVIPWGK